jgi:hypothetical protein
MPHPSDLVRALAKRLQKDVVDKTLENTQQQRTARNPAPEGGYEWVEGGTAKENLDEEYIAEFTADQLSKARLKERAAGIDPLEAKAAKVDEPREKMYQLQQFIDDAYGQPAMATRNQKGFTEADAITRGTGTIGTSGHIDPFDGPSYTIRTRLDDIEGAAENVAYPKLIEEFQELTGRAPTPEEINNRPLMERIIESVKGPDKAAHPDDIPF